MKPNLGKWWGWGALDVSFPLHERARLLPWMQRKFRVDTSRELLPIPFEQVTLESPKVNDTFELKIRDILLPEQIAKSKADRLSHAFGKSYPDLLRARKGLVLNAPDLVLYPYNHNEVQRIIVLAVECDVVLIPFGGGTNIVGAINPISEESRLIVTIDLRKMNKLLSMDSYSLLATFEAGITGPDLEAELAKFGLSLGHFPDSFEYSTLGGWAATRSAGMQSDGYGRIEDMIIGLKVATPRGTFSSKVVPATSAGPDLKRIFIGSEGVFGIITDITVKVHPTPAVKQYKGYLFQSFEDAVNAARGCIQGGMPPSMIRIHDEEETELAFHLKPSKRGFRDTLIHYFAQRIVRKRFKVPALMIVGFEGEHSKVRLGWRNLNKIFRHFSCMCLGASAARSWSKDKYLIPYLRDTVMNYSLVVDVAETSTKWSNVIHLYQKVRKCIIDEFTSNETCGYVGCHISHTYSSGVCLYFTFAANGSDKDELSLYYSIKKSITETLLREGGTLTHHHAIGIEHLPWYGMEVGNLGLDAVKDLKSSLDPNANMNSGKLGSGAQQSIFSRVA